jgi:hypothetical protein
MFPEPALLLKTCCPPSSTAHVRFLRLLPKNFPSPFPFHRAHHRRPLLLSLFTFPPSIRAQEKLWRSAVASLSSHTPFPVHAQPVVMRTACIPSSTRSFIPLSVVRRRRSVCENASPVCTRFLYFNFITPADTVTEIIDSRVIGKKGANSVP